MAFAIRLCTTIQKPGPISLSPFQTSSRLISPNLRRLQSSPLSSSSFQAPEPPSSKGNAIFPDIDFSRKESVLGASYIRNQDPNAVFVVNGASRGIGLGFVSALIERTRGTVIACCRSPETSDGLKEIISSLDSFSGESDNSASNRVRVVQLNVEDEHSMNRAISDIAKHSNGRVDLLLNVAGILGDGGKTTPGPERSIQKLDRAWMEKSMVVNAIGPLLLSQGLVPYMKCSKSKRTKSRNNNDDVVRPKTVVANLSARVGSISDNGLGGWYSYRMSKAALNQGTRTMALELKRQGTLVVALHPGTTNTDLSSPFQANVSKDRLFPVDFTVSQLLDVIDSLDDTNSGGLYDWAGKALPF